MYRNDNLKQARQAKQDEYYTQYDCVADEMGCYGNYFTGKKIYLNCDDDSSEIYHYFSNNFNALGLSSLTATCYNRAGHGCKYQYIDGATVKSELQGTGDYSSPECMRELSACDIVVTNPPFSLWREYINTIAKSQRDFIILGTLNAISYRDVWPMFMNQTLRLGYGKQNKARLFRVPDSTRLQQVPCVWFTNIFIDAPCYNQFVFTDSSPKYSDTKYSKYVNFDALNIDSVKDIPCDYYETMGVPVTYMCSHNPTLFEIVGGNQFNIDDLTPYSLYYYDEHNQVKHVDKMGHTLFVKKPDKESGRKKKVYWDESGDQYIATYARIFIRRRDRAI